MKGWNIIPTLSKDCTGALVAAGVLVGPVAGDMKAF